MFLCFDKFDNLGYTFEEFWNDYEKLSGMPSKYDVLVHCTERNGTASKRRKCEGKGFFLFKKGFLLAAQKYCLQVLARTVKVNVTIARPRKIKARRGLRVTNQWPGNHTGVGDSPADLMTTKKVNMLGHANSEAGQKEV